MFEHKFYKGFNKFNKKKKVIFLIIRKQPGEVDWILPVLNNIKNKINIIVIFEKKISLELLKQNEVLYKIFLRSICCYFINSNFKSFFSRATSKLFEKLRVSKLELYFKNKVFEEYYNVNELLEILNSKKIKVEKNSIRIVMQDFTDNSPWSKKIEREFSNCRIISFPHSTKVFSNKKNNYKIDKKKIYRNFLFLNHVYDIQNFKKKNILQNIFICGYPKYEKKWLKKIEKTSLKSFNKKKDKNIIFVSYKGFDKSKYDKLEYTNQVKSLFDYVNNFKNYKLLFKFHPNAQEEKVFLDIAKKHSKELWTITKEHLYLAIKRSNVCLSFYSNASLIDFLSCGKIPIELSNIFLHLSNESKSVYSKLGLCISLNNNIDLKRIINLTINEDKFFKKKLLKNYKKFKKIKNPIYVTSKKILEISNYK